MFRVRPSLSSVGADGISGSASIDALRWSKKAFAHIVGFRFSPGRTKASVTAASAASMNAASASSAAFSAAASTTACLAAALAATSASSAALTAAISALTAACSAAAWALSREASEFALNQLPDWVVFISPNILQTDSRVNMLQTVRGYWGCEMQLFSGSLQLGGHPDKPL